MGRVVILGAGISGHTAAATQRGSYREERLAEHQSGESRR